MCGPGTEKHVPMETQIHSSLSQFALTAVRVVPAPPTSAAPYLVAVSSAVEFSIVISYGHGVASSFALSKEFADMHMISIVADSLALLSSTETPQRKFTVAHTHTSHHLT